MDLEGYQRHLRGEGLPEESIRDRLSLIEDFDRFLDDAGLGKDRKAGKPEAEKFARRLMQTGRNTVENFSALRDHAGFTGNRPLYVAWIELMDCHNALEVLAGEIERRHGKDLREKIFPVQPPSLGADEKERCAYTRGIAERLDGILSVHQARLAWFQVQHGIPAEDWRTSDAENREKFMRSKDIDDFLDLKRRERDALLARLHEEDKLWYTVQITKEVLEFVKSDPEMEVGRREGEKIYISKIPYNAVRYLQEPDPRRKRYFACHCPLVRRAILEDRPVPADVCYCSLGHASHYLAGIGGEYRGDVLESALRGDLRCRFVFSPADA